MTKDDIRKTNKRIRDAMSIGEREIFSSKICTWLNDYINDHPKILNILCFYPKESEVSLIPLYEDLSGMYRLYFPVTDGSKMTFHMVSEFVSSSFAPGGFNINEPKDRSVIFPGDASLDEGTIVLVPGLCFDKSTKTRIGYGAGFYDRFLNDHPDILKIGVAYDFMMMDDMPYEPHDTYMDLVITNNDIYE